MTAKEVPVHRRERRPTFVEGVAATAFGNDFPRRPPPNHPDDPQLVLWSATIDGVPVWNRALKGPVH